MLEICSSLTVLSNVLDDDVTRALILRSESSGTIYIKGVQNLQHWIKSYPASLVMDARIRLVDWVFHHGWLWLQSLSRIYQPRYFRWLRSCDVQLDWQMSQNLSSFSSLQHIGMYLNACCGKVIVYLEQQNCRLVGQAAAAVSAETPTTDWHQSLNSFSASSLVTIPSMLLCCEVYWSSVDMGLSLDGRCYINTMGRGDRLSSWFDPTTTTHLPMWENFKFKEVSDFEKVSVSVVSGNLTSRCWPKVASKRKIFLRFEIAAKKMSPLFLENASKSRSKWRKGKIFFHLWELAKKSYVWTQLLVKTYL